MTTPPPVARGARELDRLLAEHTADIRRLDLPGFRGWLARHLARWRADPVFAHRAAIRDLRRANPGLRQAERAHRRAAAAAAATPEAARLGELARELTGVGKAVAGLTAASEVASADRRAALQVKLGEFEARRRALLAHQAELVRSSPTRQALLLAANELARARAAAGVDRAEARLAESIRDRGRRAGRAGEGFERVALAVTRRVTVPEVAGGGPPDRVRVLTGVTLGAARVEFDLLVVRPPTAGPVEVLAAVEAKRNINDLGHGFRVRQENLLWLTGDPAGPDPGLYRTRGFPAGRFDRPAVHEEGGERWEFGPGSFRRFRRDPATGWFLGRLYLVTRAGPAWGLSAAGLSRVAHRVATDDRWAPADDGYLGELLAWCQGLAGPVEAPDVLRAYREAGMAERVLLVGR